MAETIIQKIDSTLIIRPEDRMDASTSPLIMNMIRPYLDEVDNIIMDLEQVGYISSAGIRVITELYQIMEDREGNIRIINIRKNIMSVFRLINLEDFIDLS